MLIFYKYVKIPTFENFHSYQPKRICLLRHCYDGCIGEDVCGKCINFL